MAIPVSKRRFGRAAITAATAVVALVSTSAIAAASPVGGSGAVSATKQRVGSTPHAPSGAVAVGAPAGDTRLDLSVNLEPRDPSALRDFVKAVSTPGNAEYHHFLAKGQFASAFGPTQNTIAQVRSALRAQGLTPGAVSADGMSIAVSATVDQAAKAFGTGFRSYKLKDGSTGFQNTAAPQFASGIAAEITGVTGLNTLVRPKPLHTGFRSAARSARSLSSTHTSAATAAATGGPTCSELSSLGTDGSDYYSPQNLAASYNMEHTATSGAGVTVGVIEYESYSSSDLAHYQSCFGTKVPVSVVKVDGGATVAPNPANNIGIESLLDMEDLIGLVPGAKLINYQGRSLVAADGKTAINTSDAYWLDPIKQAVVDDNAQVLSLSWGGCELGADSTILNTELNMSLEAASQGQSLLVASGDDGAFSCGSYNNYEKAVGDPANQPYVTAVGGTTLSGNPATSRTTWNTGDGAASAGGVSRIWSLRSADSYQAGFTGSGYSSSYCSPSTGYTCRQVPDVAALADVRGYAVYVGGGWGTVGGTSGATPTWAALVAIADAQPACKANGPIGFLNYLLYGAAKSAYSTNFMDVTSGNNGIPGHSGFSAGTGYDLTTGLGEPNGANLVNTLCSKLPAAATGTSTYHPLSPKRLLDTRSSSSSAPQVPANTSAAVKITNANGIPASGVTAVVLNVTVTRTSGNGVLTVWGDNTNRPKTSNLNWTKGETISNLVTVKVPGDGWVDFYTTSATDVIADVQGYYTNDTTGYTFTAHTPKRLLDTRSKIGVSTTTPVSNNLVNVSITGNAGIPTTAKAVVLNVTATQTVGAGYIAAYPSGATRPSVSNINWTASNTTLPGLVIVPVGSNGKVSLYVHGKAHVIADVFGYFSADGALKLNTTTPTRLLDTRANIGISRTTALTAGQTVKLQVAGRAGIPSGVSAVLLNITVTGTTSSGVLTAWPDGISRPSTSNLNWAKGWTVPNLVLVPVGSDGYVDIYVNAPTHVIADVTGYFSGS